MPHQEDEQIELARRQIERRLACARTSFIGVRPESAATHRSDAGAAPGAPQYRAHAREELVQWIRDAGRIPVERDTLYNVVWSADETLAPVGAAAPLLA